VAQRTGQDTELSDALLDLICARVQSLAVQIEPVCIAQHGAYLLQAEPGGPSHGNEREPVQNAVVILTSQALPAVGADQADIFVVSQGRGFDAAAPGNLGDIQGFHLDLKLA